MTLQIQNLNELIKGHINGQILDQTVARLTAPGENYGSLMLKVDITVKNEDKEEKMHVVAKCVPPNKQMQMIFNIPITFKNEIGWYSTVIPTMKEYQKEQGAKDIADFFLEVYGTRLSLDPKSEEVDDDGIILMENLAVKGYINADRIEGFTLDQSKEILKKLATFHAVNLALKLEKPDVFNDKVKKYLHRMINDDLKFDATEPVLRFLEKNPEFAPLMPKITEDFQYMGTKGNNLKVREPWGTAVHTDFWVNNIMLKEEEGKPPKIIILDLQTCAYGSLVEDLLFFIGTSLQTHLIEKHFDELIKFYYMELMENLKVLNADTTLFPYSSFQKELELEGPVQYGHCMFFVAIILAEKDKTADSTTHEFNADDELKKMFANISDKQAKKYIVLTKEFAKRNWI